MYFLPSKVYVLNLNMPWFTEKTFDFQEYIDDL
jgi:hypothetical protein